MDFDDLRQALHVVGGPSAAGSLKFALRLGRDQVLINEDEISCGAAPATNDLGLWRSTRERFIREKYDWPEFSFDDYADDGLLTNAERLGQENSVVVWTALGLPDQLLLAWVVFLFDRLELNPSKLRMAQFETLRPRQRVLGVGELSPDNIREFCPKPRQLDLTELQEVREAWSCYTNSDPAALSTYVAQTSPMPILHRAVSELVYRYPEIQSGVSGWDERLLRYTLEKGPAAARVIGFTMGHSETFDRVGDLYLFHRLVALGNADLAAPPISITGSTRSMRECKVSLTAFGKKVLAEQANHVRKNGIDDWIGGVHLSAEAPVTFRKGNSLVLPR